MPERKPPHNVRVLQRWIGEQAKSDKAAVVRLQNRVSYTVLAAALTRNNGKEQAVFMLKGGVALELRLPERARATQDMDVAFSSSEIKLNDALAQALTQPYGDFTFTHEAPQPIAQTGAYRTRVKLSYRSHPWNSIPLEIGAMKPTNHLDEVPAFDLRYLGLEGPKHILCLGLPLQIAQKIHACTQQWTDRENRRYRDFVDLLLLRELITEPDQLTETHRACIEVFHQRDTHKWPPKVHVPPFWKEGYASLAKEVNLAISDVHEAAKEVQSFIDQIGS